MHTGFPEYNVDYGNYCGVRACVDDVSTSNNISQIGISAGRPMSIS